MKGQFNKPICAILTSLVLIFGTFALTFPPQDAVAVHNNGCGKIEILKNDVPVVTYDKCVTCAENCVISIDISKRHEALFKRACDAGFVDNFIPAQTLQIIVDCDLLHGPWDVRTTGTIDNTHGQQVTIRIFAI